MTGPGEPSLLDRVGVLLPEAGFGTDLDGAGGASALSGEARAVEASGVHAIWLTDHLFWHRPTVDVFTALGVVAAATERCVIGPGVVQVPLRDAAAVAKAAAYLEHLAPGRVVLGVGVGEHPGEYDAAGRGHRYADRGRQLDRAIVDVRAHWASTGRYRLAPAPARPLPIWVGGRHERARRRAATLGDGWMPHLCHLDWFRDQMPKLDADLAAAGRPPDGITRAALVTVAVDEVDDAPFATDWLGRLYGIDGARFERTLLRGPAAVVADAVSAFVEAGADHVALMFASSRPLDHLVALAPTLASRPGRA